MERNYDEIISEMLRQLDRHSEQLEVQSARLEAQVKKSDEQWAEQRRINAELFEDLKGQKAVTNQNLEIALQTATILDRIIKVNKLKL